MNSAQEKLLGRGVILLPEEINHETYEYVVEALVLHPGPVRMFCRGDGGGSRAALAMVDVIRAHGRVIGLLTGEANSMHSTVWASCAYRVAFPNGSIGVHKLNGDFRNAFEDSASLRATGEDWEATERDICRIFASASNKPWTWWLQTMQAAGVGCTKRFRARELVALGMANMQTPPPAPPRRQGGEKNGRKIDVVIHTRMSNADRERMLKRMHEFQRSLRSEG